MSKELTDHGRSFMRKVADHYGKNDNSLLQGNNGLLPFSDETDANKIWVANVKNIFDNNKPITTNAEYIEYLIRLYVKYSAQEQGGFNVDTNIVAAQGFEESEYRAWYYPTEDRTSASIAQIPMDMMYFAIYTEKWLNNNQISKITNGMEKPNLASSWRKVESGGNEERQKRNHSIFHQNMIDNPDIVVYTQCRFISYISLNNENYASSTLFAYNTNWKDISNNYIQILNEFSKKQGNDEALKPCQYVERIFGYLGDPKQENVDNLKSYVIGYSFSYTIDYAFHEFDVDAVTNYSPTRSTKDKEALVEEMEVGYDYAVAAFKNKYGETYNIKLSSVYRTPAHQRRLYGQGRNSRNELDPPPDTITGLDGRSTDEGGTGKSRHNYYPTEAFDFNLFNSANVFLNGRDQPDLYKELYREFFDFFKEKVPTAKWGGDFGGSAVNDVYHIQLN